MKRYFVFMMGYFYPYGGMNDYASSHDTSDEAIKAAKMLFVEDDEDGETWVDGCQFGKSEGCVDVWDMELIERIWTSGWMDDEDY